MVYASIVAVRQLVLHRLLKTGIIVVLCTYVFIIFQAAQVRYKKADDLCQKLGIDVPRHEPSNGAENSSLSEVPATFPPVSANANSVEKGRSITFYCASLWTVSICV